VHLRAIDPGIVGGHFVLVVSVDRWVSRRSAKESRRLLPRRENAAVVSALRRWTIAAGTDALLAITCLARKTELA